MFKKTLSILSLLCLLVISSSAQSVIKIPFRQAPLFDVSAESIYLQLPEGGVELGADLVISGGSGEYSYTWSLNNVIVGTMPTLFVNATGDYYLEITDANDCKRNVKFSVTGGTDISSEEYAQITVFPNPTVDVVNMSSPYCDQLKQISIVSTLGKLVRVYHSIPVCHDNTITITISDLPKGTYLISYIFDNGILTKQVILQ